MVIVIQHMTRQTCTTAALCNWNAYAANGRHIKTENITESKNTNLENHKLLRILNSIPAKQAVNGHDIFAHTKMHHEKIFTFSELFFVVVCFNISIIQFSIPRNMVLRNVFAQMQIGVSREFQNIRLLNFCK